MFLDDHIVNTSTSPSIFVSFLTDRTQEPMCDLVFTYHLRKDKPM